MGRTEPSVGKPPASFRRDARAKRAKATANKVIPAVLAAHPRARRGIEASELITDPPRNVRAPVPQRHAGKSSGGSGDRRNEGGGRGEGEGESEKRAENGNGDQKSLRVSLRVADTLSTAYSLLLVPVPSPEAQDAEEQRRDLSNSTARVGVLNMASPLAPGGGFLNGATGQEEASLCARTTLLPALCDEFYRLPELGGVFTPDVLVFRSVDDDAQFHGKRKRMGKGKGRERDDEHEGGEEDRGGGRCASDEENELLPKRGRWFVDVATAAMLRLPEIEVDAESGWASYASANDRELAVRKMRGVMRIFASKGVKRVVLGAWGCGAYGNPVGEIARAWRKVLLGGAGTKEGDRDRESRGKGKKDAKEKTNESWEGIEHIVFAIKDAGMARAFATAFGEDLLDRCDEDEDGDDDFSGGERDVEDEKVKELRSRIQELELQAEQARTLQLRSGLNSVLVGLRAQLPEYGSVHSRQSTTDRKEGSQSSRDEASGSEDDDGQSAGDESE